MKSNPVLQEDSPLKWFYLAGFFFVLFLPLLNLPPWFMPPEWSKAVLFRGIALLGVAGLGAALLFRPSILQSFWQIIRSHAKPLSLLGGYLGVLALSAFLSENVQQSFLGTLSRGEGVLDFLLLFLFILLLLAFATERSWRVLWGAAIGTGVLVALVALFQQFGSLSDVFVTISSRPGSTIGGPAFLALYLLLLAFPALAFGLHSNRSIGKVLYLGAFALFAAVVVLGLTRGAYLGLFFGLAWFVGWYPGGRVYRKAAKLLILAGVLLGVLGLVYLNIAQLPEPLREVRFVSALQNRLQVETLLEARLGIWTIGWEAAKEELLLGYGYENASVGLNKHYDPSLPGIPSVAWWPDRAHNIILDILLAGGIGALALFVLFLGYLAKKLQQAKREDPSRAVLFHGIQALLAAYVAANLFNFDSFSTLLLFFFAVGYALFLLRPSLEKPSSPRPARFLLPTRILGALLVPLALLLAWPLSISPFFANAAVNQAAEPADKAECEESFSRFEDLASKEYLAVVETHIERSYANTIDQCIHLDPSLASHRTTQYQLLGEVAEQRGTHAESWIDLGGLATTLAEQAINQGQPEKAARLFQEAEDAFLKAQELSSNRPQMLERWAVKELAVGNYASAGEKTQRCVALDETRGTCWWWKGIAEIFQKNIEEADRSIERAREEGYNTGGPQQQGQLARAYAAAGAYGRAREAANKLLRLRPSVKEEIEAFLNSLPR